MKRIFSIMLLGILPFSGCSCERPETHGPSPRIVSFSPALTDLLYDMGLGDHVVGVTSYCIVPEGSNPPVVGNRTRIGTEAILVVRPDVILIQQNPDDFGAIRSIDPNIIIEHIRIETLDDVGAAIERIGEIAGAETVAGRHRKVFTDKLESLRRASSGSGKVSVLFLMGYDRPATGGKGTFIDEMINLAGGINAATRRGYVGWKNLNRENILAMSPEVLIYQVPEDQADQAREYFKTFKGLPAVETDRLFVATDRRWTIPSMRSVDLVVRMARWIGGGSPAGDQRQ